MSPRIEIAYVYMLASKGKRLYIGVTTQIENRVAQHKRKADPDSFTARYNINRLVHLERFTTIVAAIAREKELKGWTRMRKIALIVSANPDWKDLSADWGKPVTAFSESNLRQSECFQSRTTSSPQPAEYRDPSLRSG